MKKQEYRSGIAHLIIVIIVTLVLLGALGFVVWKNFDRFSGSTNDTSKSKDENTDNSKNNTKTSEQSDLTANAIISGAYDSVYDKYASDSTSISKTIGTLASPTFKPAGAKYYVTTKSASGLYISQTDQTSTGGYLDPAIARTINTYLLNSKLTKDADPNCGVGGLACYRSPSVICRSSDNGTNENTFFLELTCANASDFTSAYDATEPFADALSSGGRTIDGNSVLGVPDIKDSPVTGYQNAYVTISQTAVGLFYKTPNGEWQYLMTTQNGLFCSYIDTDDLRAAFKGTACYDSSGNEITVQ